MYFAQRFSVEHGKDVYVEWYNGTYDIFFEESRTGLGERRWKKRSVKRRSKDGGLQQTQQNSFTDEHAGGDDCKLTSGGISLAIEGCGRSKEPSSLFL